MPALFPQLIADLCTRCHRCEVACVEVRYGAPLGGGTYDSDDPFVLEHRRLAVRETARETGGLRLEVCTSCPERPCLPTCPHHALLRWPDGRIELREDRCTGCGRCISACPVRGLRRATDLSLALKCDGCAPLGRAPACVEACPSRALILHEGSLPLP